jgi:hypothetical protein
VGELNHLQTVVRHVAGEVFVDFHHRTAEVFAIATHGEFGTSIGGPFGESFGELLVIPSEEEVGEFVVVDGVSVGRVGEPDVAGFAEVACVIQRNFRVLKKDFLFWGNIYKIPPCCQK